MERLKAVLTRRLGSSRAASGAYRRPMTRIGVIGGGNIGRTVGAAWQRAGHDVVYSSRSPAPPETVSIPDAIAHAEVVLLSTPGDAVPGLLAEHGAALDGRVVIDATNDVGGAVDGVG